jgi:SAM-dependent methyltransferase
MSTTTRPPFWGIPNEARRQQLESRCAGMCCVRIDRVLHHIADPAPAILEIVRVLRPGGVLAAFDNDWETLTVDSADRATTRVILNAWWDRFPSGWIGCRLVPLFLKAGLGDVVTSPKTLVLRELEVADRVFSLFRPPSDWRRRE